MIFALYVYVADAPNWLAYEKHARLYTTEVACLRSASLARKRHRNVITYCVRFEGLETSSIPK